MRITGRYLMHLFPIFFLLQFTLYAKAVECVAPDGPKNAEISAYVIKKYQIASTSSLVLASSAKANNACYWKMEYATTSPKQSYVLYLSPDRKYLTPAIYDISLDPLAEIREQDAKLAKDLLFGSNPGIGLATAPVTIVEFSDFQCPYCKRMADTLEKEVLPKESTKVNVVFRNYPLPMHPWAKPAAEIAECAALQKPEAFWAMHDFFFQNQQTMTVDGVRAQAIAFAATRKDLNQTEFQSCVDHELSLGPITQDQQLGDKLGVHGTPSLFINGVRFDGVRSADETIQLIEQAAKGELVSPPAARTTQTASTAAARPSTAQLANAAAQCAPLGTARTGGIPNAQ